MEILCETSVRHVHLCQQDVETLFGAGVQLEFDRALSQPGQFLSKQRVTLVGAKRELINVAVLGPARKQSQVEVSQTDAFTLGMRNVPVRQSGDLQGTPGIRIRATDSSGTETSIELTEGVIIAKRHVHLDPQTAQLGGFTDNEIVQLKFTSCRAAILDEVVVRVDKNFAPAVHLDSDEANAVMAGDKVTVIKK